MRSVKSYQISLVFANWGQRLRSKPQVGVVNLKHSLSSHTPSTARALPDPLISPDYIYTKAREPRQCFEDKEETPSQLEIAWKRHAQTRQRRRGSTFSFGLNGVHEHIWAGPRLFWIATWARFCTPKRRHGTWLGIEMGWLSNGGIIEQGTHFGRSELNWLEMIILLFDSTKDLYIHSGLNVDHMEKRRESDVDKPEKTKYASQSTLSSTFVFIMAYYHTILLPSLRIPTREVPDPKNPEERDKLKLLRLGLALFSDHRFCPDPPVL